MSLALKSKCIAGLLAAMLAGSLGAAEKPGGPPPAVVAVAQVTAGRVRPQAEFVATVFYREVSDVATELAGLVEQVHFEEGQHVAAGQVLAELRVDLLQKRLKATAASHQQVLAELAVARLNLARRQALFRKQAISEQQFDEIRFQVKALERRAASLAAEVERLQLEVEKSRIRAPFDGVIVQRRVDRGEWMAAGQTAAVLARDDEVDIVAEVPERYVRFASPGMAVEVRAGDRRLQGTVVTVIPRADAATRTAPVKVRAPNSAGLIEGMSAVVLLPTGEPQPALLVPRDALVSVAGRTGVWVVNSDRAHLVPVEVLGYEGLTCGLRGQGLAAGMQVVVKGNERLREGQPVRVSAGAPPLSGSRRPVPGRREDIGFS